MTIQLNKPYKTVQGTNKNKFSFYNTNCTEGLSDLADKSIDIVVTSPPYNRSISYGLYKDNLPRPDYLSWIETVGTELRRVLKDDGSFFLNFANKPSDQWISYDVCSALRSLFNLQNTIIWAKSISVKKIDIPNNSNIINDFSIGHYQPVNSPFFLNNYYEYIFHLTKYGNVELDKQSMGYQYQDKSNIKRWKSALGDKKPVGNLLFIPYETIQSKRERPHPAIFPYKLPELCINLHGCREGQIVLDPFCGIGSTALAAMKLGVSFTGYDIDKTYLDEAVRRIQDFRDLQSKDSLHSSIDKDWSIEKGELPIE